MLDRHGFDGEALVERALSDTMSGRDVDVVHDALSSELVENGGIMNGHVTPYGERLERLADLIADREHPNSSKRDDPTDEATSV